MGPAAWAGVALAGIGLLGLQLTRLALILILILVGAVIAWFIQLPYYALTPGSAPEVSSLIKVPSADRHSHRGSVLLVYVELTPDARALLPVLLAGLERRHLSELLDTRKRVHSPVHDRGRDRHVDGPTGRHGRRPQGTRLQGPGRGARGTHLRHPSRVTGGLVAPGG